ncbi:hypothetical protein B484DRAFT_481793 [Ochromonadaceae sp. CCMP2298]|nr:hypothetical protein B484DRAFT_481793 [Ochromonadaceae sp. CCMP2298]|mmetsp:Transcript_7302/g.15971  ORF Transcript_7302/g.15971 Transcript_7302/m.15971 type:complete len:612 (-) Transcript_7302:141-1976(-)
MLRLFAALLLALVSARSVDGYAPFIAARTGNTLQRNKFALASTTTPPDETLTQREYLVAVRNRLFAVEEQIWLHEYAKSRAAPKVEPLSDAKYKELVRARGELMEEYPLTQLYDDLYDAQQRNLTYAVQYLDRLISDFSRQMPVPMEHVNQIAVLSSAGTVINLMRGQGAVYQRLHASSAVMDPTVKRQFQHPTFSPSGKYVSFAEMHFKDEGFIRSDALVFEVANKPETYGLTDTMPMFDSGELPGAPFFLRFSPDEESIVMLCTAPNTGTESQSYSAIVMMDWGKYFRKDTWAGSAAKQRFAPRKALTLLQGDPVFFTYTTSNPKNATIVAHCQKEVVSEEGGSTLSEQAVWMLQRQDTGGVQDFTWNKISDSGSQPRWSTPICHSAGGGDSVMVVEDGWLVSKSLSRWKRNEDGSLKSKKLMQLKGQVQFLVSPDNTRLVVLEEDINQGHYALTVIEGEDALDPASTSMGKKYELPNSKLTVAFWFSPDSTKLLCLTAAGKSQEDVKSLKSSFKVALNSEMQWSVFNFPLQELREYDAFKPTSYFMRTYVPFFSQYAQSYNPWAPDSRSFIFMTSTGLSHTPLVGSKICLGVDKWENQGATFGTWSRQ